MAGLVLAAAALATRPWWLKPAATLRRRSANVAAYRTRLDELEAERAAGLVSAQGAEALKAELGSRLLAEDQAEAPVAAPAAPRPWVALLLLLLLAVFAGGWYALSGSWQAQQQIAAARAQDQQVQAMVQKLAEHLHAQPEDADGWALLGRSYFVMQKFADAAQAYGQANAHAPEPNAEWLAGQGEALGFAGNRELQGRPAELFERALKLDPENGKALWYAGLASAEAGDADQARQRWQKLLLLQGLPPDMRELVQTRLAALGAPAAAGGVVLDLRISLDPRLASRAPQDAVLFVFAKAQGGPPMPLAVKLDDSMAMSPALRLSQFDRYTVTARLSRGGGAQAQTGDLEGSLDLGRGEAGKPLQLLIDREVH